MLFVIILPFLGVLVYLIARGGKMHERAAEQAAQQQKAFDAYVKEAAGSGGSADELAKLADLKEKGAITQAEFDTQKAKILGLTHLVVPARMAAVVPGARWAAIAASGVSGVPPGQRRLEVPAGTVDACTGPEPPATTHRTRSELHHEVEVLEQENEALREQVAASSKPKGARGRTIAPGC